VAGYSGTPLAKKLGIKEGAKVVAVDALGTKKAELASYRKKLDPSAAVWVSWPKKASKVATDITEDVVREVALPLGLRRRQGVCRRRRVVASEACRSKRAALDAWRPRSWSFPHV
jgi:hypothetical protein